MMMMITPRSMVNLQKLIVAQLVKKFTAVYATEWLKSTIFWYVTPYVKKKFNDISEEHAGPIFRLDEKAENANLRSSCLLVA
jgi:hypothetical protein